MADYTAKKNEKLLSLIHSIKESGEDTGGKLEEELSSGLSFYMPVRIAGKTSRDRKLTFGVTQDKQGHHYYMIFTDRDRLKKWANGERVQIIVNTFQACCDTAYGDPRIFGFIINPSTDDFVIGRQIISDVRMKLKGQETGMEAVKQNAEDTIVFKSPRSDKVTEELVSYLTGYMRADRNVAAAYICDMERNSHTDYCIVIRHIGAMDETFPSVMEIAKKHSHGRSVALLSARAPIAERAIKGLKPFYRKAFEMVD